MKRKIYLTILCVFIICALTACTQDASSETGSALWLDESSKDAFYSDSEKLSEGDDTESIDDNEPAGADTSIESGSKFEASLESENKFEDPSGNISLVDEVSQMFIVEPDSVDILDYPVGGFIYFADHITGYDEIKSRLSSTKAFYEETVCLPMFACVDEEGGIVARVANSNLPGITNVGSMADIDSAQAAYDAGYYIGTYLSDIGFNVDFAPDADVLTNPENTAIGARSFGSDAEDVTRKASSLSRALQDTGVLSTFKHFPGHGGTSGDTHEGFSSSLKNLDEMYSSELVPFMAAKDAKPDFIMVSHISIPDVDDGNTPASLSSSLVTKLLRNEIGYEGIIITDAMNMGAITEKYDASEAAVLAVLAGNDMILMPEDAETAINAVIEAVASGRISRERIDQSYARILSAKSRIN